MRDDDAGVRASVGFASERGQRKQNEDFAAAVIGAELPEPRREVVAAIADGVGGTRGGRVAAERKNTNKLVQLIDRRGSPRCDCRSARIAWCRYSTQRIGTDWAAVHLAEAALLAPLRQWIPRGKQNKLVLCSTQ